MPITNDFEVKSDETYLFFRTADGKKRQVDCFTSSLLFRSITREESMVPSLRRPRPNTVSGGEVREKDASMRKSLPF